MVKETEIKLRVSRDTLAALREHPLLKKRNKSGWEQRELFNQYFDTPARDLARAKVALRIRRDGDAFIQTLKSRGQSVAGLSERNEFDWYLERPELEPGLRVGEPTALRERAGQPAADLPLMPSDISKAERGYRLFDANSYSL